jgi:hypothetical protein
VIGGIGGALAKRCHGGRRIFGARRPEDGLGRDAQYCPLWPCDGVSGLGQNAQTTGGAGILPAAILRDARLKRRKWTALGETPQPLERRLGAETRLPLERRSGAEMRQSLEDCSLALFSCVLGLAVLCLFLRTAW